MENYRREDDVLNQVSCPTCETKIDELDFIEILTSESNLSYHIPEKLTIWANCKHCNNVYAISFWNNTKYPKIKVTMVSALEEFIEHLNKEYEKAKDCCSWYPFKVEDYKQ